MSAPASAAAVRVRPLGLADLPEVARVHRAAFPESAMTALGAGAVRRYYAWQLTGPHDGFSVAAEDGSGRLAGFCFGGVYRGALTLFVRRHWAYLGWRVLLALPRVAGPNLRRAVAMAPGLLRGSGSVKKAAADPARPRPASFGILAIAVDPAAQGSPAARALMDAAEAEARRRGFARMHLSVRPDNARAVRFYEKCGWVRVARGPEWTGRMEKALEGGG